MATAPSPNELTRQQLDELDALLQRMLALPLNPPETPSPAQPGPRPGNGRGVGDEPTAATPHEPPPALPHVAPNWRVDPPAAPAPHLLLAANALPLPDPIPEPVPAPEPVVERPPVPPQPAFAPRTRNELSAAERGAAVRELTPEPPAPEPMRVVAPRSSDSPQHPDLPPLPSRPAATTVAPPTPWALAPLVAVNRLTDGVLGLFGPLGKLARSGFGRNVFGLAGVLLLAYTAARVAQVSGLLALPFPLPWPR